MILKNKVILVSGAGSGIASAICLSAAALGARLALTFDSVAADEAIANSILAQGGEAIALPASVESSRCEQLVAAALEEWGQLDGLIDVAYCVAPPFSPEYDEIEQIAGAIDASAIGGLRAKQAVFPTMRRQGFGIIVNVSTLRRTTEQSAESDMLSRSALAEMTRQLAAQLAETGVRVNTVLMGWSNDPPIQSLLDAVRQKDARVLRGKVPDLLENGPFSEESCAAITCFLLSDPAKGIRGSTLDLNELRWIFP